MSTDKPSRPMKCTHEGWEWGPMVQDEETGEWRDTSRKVSLFEDKVPGDGRFECKRCGHVGYYTGSWRRFWEEGIPCPGSERFAGSVKETPNG